VGVEPVQRVANVKRVQDRIQPRRQFGRDGHLVEPNPQRGADRRCRLGRAQQRDRRLEYLIGTS